jgi:hypothetical protein
MGKRKPNNDVHKREIAASFGGAFRVTTQTSPPNAEAKPGWMTRAAKWTVGALVSGGLTITIWWTVIPDDPHPAPRALPDVIWC